jgi:hypothetical protein
MTVGELLDLLQGQHIDRRAQLRIGDQVESGPYLHASIGGVFAGSEGSVILTANDDEVWTDESAFNPDVELKVLWAPDRG